LGQVRRTQRYASILSDEDTALVAHVVSLATEYGRYGYRRITALLRADGWPASCSNNSDSPRRPKHASTSSTPPESRPEVAHQRRQITSTWDCGRKPVIVHQGGATPLFCQPIRGDFNWWSIRVSQKNRAIRFNAHRPT